MAASLSLDQLILQLLDHSADINARDSYELTALHVATLHGHVATVDLLLQSKSRS